MTRILLIILVFATFPCVAQQPINLNSYYRCWAKLVEGDDAISFLAPTQAECRSGNAVLAYQKFLGSKGSKAIYEISDTLNIRTGCPENCLYITTCEGNSESRAYIILIREDYSNEYFEKVNLAWAYTTNGKLKEVDPSTLKCLNEDFVVD
ncbi:hypothetical protein [Reichenbachiella ulvae]|uniref:Uncharacterized protein n=1 Tax=Reichenbachiella ulvae TaxID=2980104 RepID=A0ABT3CR99_9BACT|nr:hypothetical protein [Reichenbachiella ulvae]MCV9386187.1 hypothetical protein [Reichenbachiella ulvae]